MSRFKVSVLADFEITAHDHDAAESIIRESIKNLALPPISPPTSLDITSRLISPPDTRLLVHIPNLSPSELRNQIAAMSDIEQSILEWCSVQPFSSYNLLRLLQKQAATPYHRPAADDIRRAITRLQNRGWLSTVQHNIEQDSFTDARLEGIRALFSSHSTTTSPSSTEAD